MPNKLTDAEVKKALEVCIDGYCRGCCYGDTDQRHCRDDLMQEALDLINRLEARIGIYETCNARKDEAIKSLENSLKTAILENESLKAEVERLEYANETNISSIGTLHKRLKTIKAEAYTEFAERLKDESEHFELEKENFVSEEQIDNLLNELVGDGDG